MHKAIIQSQFSGHGTNSIREHCHDYMHTPIVQPELSGDGTNTILNHCHDRLTDNLSFLTPITKELLKPEFLALFKYISIKHLVFASIIAFIVLIFSFLSGRSRRALNIILSIWRVICNVASYIIICIVLIMCVVLVITSAYYLSVSAVLYNIFNYITILLNDIPYLQNLFIKIISVANNDCNISADIGINFLWIFTILSFIIGCLFFLHLLFDKQSYISNRQQLILIGLSILIYSIVIVSISYSYSFQTVYITKTIFSADFPDIVQRKELAEHLSNQYFSTFQKTVLWNISFVALSLLIAGSWRPIFRKDEALEDGFFETMVKTVIHNKCPIILGGDYSTVRRILRTLLTFIFTKGYLGYRAEDMKILWSDRSGGRKECLLTNVVAIIKPETAKHRVIPDPRLGKISYIRMHWGEDIKNYLPETLKFGDAVRNIGLNVPRNIHNLWNGEQSEIENPRMEVVNIIVPAIIDDPSLTDAWVKAGVKKARLSFILLPDVNETQPIFNWFHDNDFPALVGIQGGVYQMFAIRRIIKSPTTLFYYSQMQGFLQGRTIFHSLLKALNRIRKLRKI